MEFVAVRGGVFGMGCGIWAGWCFDNEKPAHTVRINPFWMGRTEVTVGQFTAFVNATGYRTEAERGDGCTVWQVGSAGATSVVAAEANYRSPGYKLTDSHPVTCVSWNDVRAYTEWLSQKGAPKFRLPTEAEWEFACRVAGRQVTYGTYGTGNPNGNLRGSLSRYDTFEGPVPVHSYRENALGLFDMSGNVGEWVQDAFAPYQADAGGAADNPVVSAGDKRIRRGGSWFYEARVQRCGNRAGWTPSARTDDLGFRLVVK
jgi:formylglycine-generating enzyme required for sulfatase activity